MRERSCDIRRFMPNQDAAQFEVPLITRLTSEGSLWPLLLSVVIHLVLLGAWRSSETLKANDFIMIDLTVSSGSSSGTGEAKGKPGRTGGVREKQADHSIVKPSPPSQQSNKLEQRAALAIPTTANQTTSVSHASKEFTTPPISSSESSVSDRTPVAALEGGKTVVSLGSGDLGTAGIGSGFGEARGTSGDGNGSGGVVDGVLGAPGGPSFATKVSPVYPPFARRMGKEGVVRLRLFLDENGILKDAEIIKKAGYGFDDAALAAVRASAYHPAVRHGRPAPCRALLSVKFELQE